jgi:hypothetical protein
VRFVGKIALSALALVGLWMLYVGIASRLELLWGIGCAVAAAAATAAVARAGRVRFAADWPWLGSLWKLPRNLVYDFVLVLVVLARSLARGEKVRGAFVVRGFPAGDERARDAFRRGWVTTLSNSTPNALVVDLQPGGDALMHALAPDARTAEKVW